MPSSHSINDPITASVRYLENDQNLAVYQASVAGGELVSHEGNYVDVPVALENARHCAETELETEGFVLVNQATRVTDFYNDAQLEEYEKDVKQTIKDATGSTDCLIFDHTRRSSSAALRKQKNIREAASVIHNDYSAASGHVRLQDYLQANSLANADDYLKRDFAIINIWRSIAGEIANFPLAFCFANSVADDDLVPVKRQGAERVGEIQLLLQSKSHRWTWFPQMQMDEALVFKTFDTRDDGRARFVPHTSIELPDASVDTPARQSIETRCFVFF